MNYVICEYDTVRFLYKQLSDGLYVLVHATLHPELFNKFNRIEFKGKDEINIKILRNDVALKFINSN